MHPLIGLLMTFNFFLQKDLVRWLLFVVHESWMDGGKTVAMDASHYSRNGDFLFSLQIISNVKFVYVHQGFLSFLWLWHIWQPCE